MAKRVDTTNKVNVMNRNPEGVHECYFCGGLVPDAELVTMKVPLVCKGGKIREYQRKLHASCGVKYSMKRKDHKGSLAETGEWEELYEYVRELLYGKGGEVPDFMRMRLQGLRVNEFVAKATNRKLLERGYSYKTILKTFIFSKPTIVNVLQTQHFKDEDHRINAVMFIVKKNIAEIDRRIKNQESASKKLKSAIEDNELDTRSSKKVEYVKQDRDILPTMKFNATEEDYDKLFD